MVAIKAQLTDLRNMMRMSFDVQLDIQRAIRQEVSATVNNVMNGEYWYTITDDRLINVHIM